MALSLGGINCGCCGQSGCHSVTDISSTFCPNVHDVVTVIDSTLGLTVDMQYVGGGWAKTVSYSYPGLGGCPAKTLTLQYSLDSLIGTFAVTFISWLATGCPDDSGDCASFGLCQGAGGLITMTSCSSFAATVAYTTPATGPVAKLYGASTPISFSLSSPSATSCCIRFHVRGYNSLDLDGAAVSVWTDSGKTSLVATGTTSAGYVVLDVGTSGTYYEISKSRFTTTSATVSFTCGDTITETLSAASGYHCITGCEIPVPDTLHATHPVFGAVTYTYSGGNWVATVSYAYPGLGACPSKTVTVTCTWNGNTTYTESWKYAVTNCPDDTGGSTATVTWTDGTLVCPMSFSKGFSHTPAGTPEQNLYGAAAMTLTITE